MNYIAIWARETRKHTSAQVREPEYVRHIGTENTGPKYGLE